MKLHCTKDLYFSDGRLSFKKGDWYQVHSLDSREYKVYSLICPQGDHYIPFKDKWAKHLLESPYLDLAMAPYYKIKNLFDI